MNFKKKYVVVVSTIFIFFIVSIIIYKNNINNTAILIPKPQKIVIYNSGKSKIIDENNKSFNKILNLISERLKSIEEVRENIELKQLNEINTSKDYWTCIEFVYDDPTSFKVNLNNGSEEQLKIKKAFFLISAEASLDFGVDMIYGEDEYTSKLKKINTDKRVMLKLLTIIEREVPYN